MELLKELTTIVRCVLRALCSPPQERAVARIVLWVRTWTKRGKHTVLIVPQTRTIMKIKKLPVKNVLLEQALIKKPASALHVTLGRRQFRVRVANHALLTRSQLLETSHAPVVYRANTRSEVQCSALLASKGSTCTKILPSCATRQLQPCYRACRARRVLLGRSASDALRMQQVQESACRAQQVESLYPTQACASSVRRMSITTPATELA